MNSVTASYKSPFFWPALFLGAVAICTYIALKALKIFKPPSDAGPTRPHPDHQQPFPATTNLPSNPIATAAPSQLSSPLTAVAQAVAKTAQKTIGPNTTNLLGDPIDELPPERVFTCRHGYNHDVLEIERMVKESYYGAFINPYTSQPFTDEEIRVIIDRVMRGAEKSQLPEYMTQLNSQASRVPKEIAASLAQLAFICVADFNEKTNYADSSTAYISFIRHLNSLSSETQNAVRRFVIIYKDTKSNPPIQKRWALGELLDGMGRGDVCNHQAAVYYFTAAKQIDPSVIDLLDEETRQRFAHENHYHHGLDFERVPLVPAWILKLLTERPKSK